MHPSAARWLRLSLFVPVLLSACAPPLAATPSPTSAKPAAPPTSTPAPAAKVEAPPKPAEAVAANATDPLAAVTAKYYQAARAEGKLVLYGVGPKELWDPLKAAFQKRYPGVELEGLDQRGRESREKVIAEQRGKAYQVDIVISGFKIGRAHV